MSPYANLKVAHGVNLEFSDFSTIILYSIFLTNLQYGTRLPSYSVYRSSP